MIVLQFLRMLGDLSFYYAYAGFIVACTGSAFNLPGLLIPSVCYALSAKLQKNRNRRLAVLLPELICFFLPGMTWPDRIALIPAVLYTVYLAWIGNYDLTSYRQKDVFTMFWKIYPFFFLFCWLLGGLDNLVSDSLPFVVVLAVVSIFLLRVLRHEPDVYNQPQFLLRNLLPLVIILIAAWILQIPAVFNALVSAVKALYSVTLLPILLGISAAAGYLFMRLLSPIFNTLQSEEESDVEISTSSDLSDLEMGSTSEGFQLFLQVLKAVFIIAVIVAVVIVLILLFKRMAGKKEGQYSGLQGEERRSTDYSSQSTGGQSQPLSPRDPVNQVRRQYRKYLRICISRGFSPHTSFTSRDVVSRTEKIFPDPAPVEELRGLYIEARYHGSATKEDAARARELVSQLKQQLPKIEN